jgi:hypothetical protein
MSQNLPAPLAMLPLWLDARFAAGIRHGPYFS